MNPHRPIHWILALVLGCSLALPSGLRAEFYRYVTDDGQVHYVDDLTHVPEKYLDQVETFTEMYDHLSTEERALMLQRDRDRDRQRTLEERQYREQRQKEREQKRYETDVIIQGNQVLVPVTIGHDNRSDQALFLLDTGATHLVIFKDFADRFNLKAVKKGFSKVAGGGLVPSELAMLDYVQVGPLRVENPGATIIENRSGGGRAFEFNGLLGIDILQHIEYTIDFENKKIRWKPKS